MKPEGCVETTWRVKAWYLKTFSGHRILSVHSRPIVNLGTSVVYRRSYVLVPSVDASASESQLSAA